MRTEDELRARDGLRAEDERLADDELLAMLRLLGRPAPAPADMLRALDRQTGSGPRSRPGQYHRH